MKPYDKRHIPLARALRKHMTPEERKLWHLFLKTYAVRFRRQCAIEGSIADFYCPKAKLVVELDGTQHFKNEGLRTDALRTEQFESLGLRVIRFSNRQIHEEFEGVCQHIHHAVENSLKEEIR